MIGMIKSIAQEYAKRGVTANCIAPGFIATAMTDKLNDKQREAILTRVPAGRLGSGADVAAAARLPRLRRGCLYHRPDVAYQRRNGDVLAVIRGCRTRSAGGQRVTSCAGQGF
jgi:NAD(P)-dependent dehydrogenase (short-subunit alcohol dehydrogenase family)